MEISATTINKSNSNPIENSHTPRVKLIIASTIQNAFSARQKDFLASLDCHLSQNKLAGLLSQNKREADKGLGEERKRYRSFLKGLPNAPAEILKILNDLPKEQIYALRQLFDQFSQTLKVKEIEALLSFEIAKMTLKKIRPINQHELIKYPYLGVLVVCACGIFNAFQSFLVSPSLTYFYKKLTCTPGEEKILDFTIDFRLALLFGVFAALFGKYRTLMQETQEADTFIQKSMFQKEFQLILKKKFTHQILIKKAPQNSYETIKAFLTNAYGETLINLKDSSSLSKRLYQYVKGT